MSEIPANRLIRETSPYLLQHARNPVDWYPWGAEALERARSEDKPIFLSVGYSACHWCHVMERECFEDPVIAGLMNQLFVNVKVDREERPDVDEVYMKAVQILTHGGGWPMSVWLTPDGRPFFAGTYFPPEDRYGRPGFPTVCREMARRWSEQRDKIQAVAQQLTGEIQRVALPWGEGAPAQADLLRGAAERLKSLFDSRHGGFGGAPKFPHPMDLSLLLAVHARAPEPALLHVVETTLDKMARGGIYDQLGGGFHRYSVDERWLVPHFEKMLYDNALLAGTYLDAWLVTGRMNWRAVVQDVLDYVLREMTSPDGAFYSTQDADSEGEEGRFFAWTQEQIQEVLGEADGAVLADLLGVTRGGNFEGGTSVLSRSASIEEVAQRAGRGVEEVQALWERGRRELFEARERREKPGRDEKVLADWNGMMIRALARAGFHLAEPRYVEAARRAAEFCRERLWSGGRLLRTCKDGRARLDGNLGDYALLTEGLLDLYQVTFDPAWLRWARELVQVTFDHFLDPAEGGFFFTADDSEQLIVRSKEAYDGATPSAPSVHVGNLLRLGELLGDPQLRSRAEQTLHLYHGLMSAQPQAVSKMIGQVAFLHGDTVEVVLSAERSADLEPLLGVLRGSYDGYRVMLGATADRRGELEELTPLVRGREPTEGRATAHVCRGFACQLPTTDPEELRQQALPRGR